MLAREHIFDVIIARDVRCSFQNVKRNEILAGIKICYLDAIRTYTIVQQSTEYTNIVHCDLASFIAIYI